MQTTTVIAATARLLGQHHWIKGRRHFRHVHALKSDYEFQLMALYGDANCVYLMDTLTSLRNETQKLKCKLLEANVIRRPKVEPKNAGQLEMYLTASRFGYKLDKQSAQVFALPHSSCSV